MNSESVAQRVRADVLSGQELKIGAAPAVFLNGKRLTYWHIQATWERLLGIPQSQPASAQP
jgi:hypothetical protein